MSDHFTCDGCGETFVKAWSDEEAEAEFQLLFPENSEDDEKAVLCQGCHELVQGQLRGPRITLDLDTGSTDAEIREAIQRALLQHMPRGGFYDA